MRTIRGLSTSIPATEDSAKYAYTREEGGNYVFPHTQAQVVHIVTSGSGANSISEGEEGIIFLDQSSFYAEAGGQVGDRGHLVTEDGAVFQVTDTQLAPANRTLVAHLGRMTGGQIRTGHQISARIDPQHRLRCMQNHTCTHVLNSVLHQLLPLTCQRSSLVTPDYLRFEFSVFNRELDLNVIKEIEERVLNIIARGVKVEREAIDSDQLINVQGLVTLPGEVYPRDVTLIHLDGLQVEPCCGTHLASAADINNFVVVSCRTPSAGLKSVRALTGDAARKSRSYGIETCEQILAFQERIEQSCEDLSLVNLDEIKKHISHWKSVISEPNFPYILSQELSDILDRYQQRVKLSERAVQKTAVADQMKSAIHAQKDLSFFITTLSLTGKSKFSLLKAAKQVEKPSLILALTESNQLKGKAMVPPDLVTEHFNARTWMGPVLAATGGIGSAPRGQSADLHFNLKAVQVNDEAKLEEALQAAEDLARQHLNS